MKRKKESEKEKPLFSFSVDDGNEIEKAKRVKFSSEILRKGFEKILGTADKMLKEDVKDYSEVGVKKSGNLKIEHGFRMQFLDEAEGSSWGSSTDRAVEGDKEKKEEIEKRYFKINFGKKKKKKNNR